MKKLVACLIGLFALVNIVWSAETIYEVDGLKYFITSESAVTLYGMSDAHSTDVVIPSNVKIESKEYSVTAILENAFSLSGITSVTIPSSVITINRSAFFKCSKLKTVMLSDSSEPLNIDNWFGQVFGSCNIDSVYLGRDIVDISTFSINFYVFGNGVKKVHIGPKVHRLDVAVFGSQTSLTSFTIDEGLTELGDKALSGFSSLKDVKLPSTLVTIGKQAFASSAIKGIVIPEKVKCINEETFSKATALEFVSLPEGLETIEARAFYGCYHLAAVRLPGSLKVLGESAFENCNRLKEALILGGLKQLGSRTFYHCDSLKTIVLPEELEEVGTEAFAYCASLVSFEYPKNVKTVHCNTLSYCDGLTKIVYGESVTSMDQLGFVPYWSSKVALDTLVVKFKEPCAITKTHQSKIILVVPKGCGPAFRRADYWNSNLIQEVGEDYVAVDVKEPGTLYSEINKQISPAKVAKLKVSGELNGDDWKILKHDRTPMLYSLDLSGVTNKSIPDNQFKSKTWLTDIILPDGLEMIGNYAFQNCSRLTGTLLLPGSFNKFGSYSMNGTRFGEVILSSEVSVGDHSFENCTLMRSISSEFITSIGSSAFIGCKSLESFSTSSKLKSIGAFAFQDCSNLRNLILNEGVEILQEYSFGKCTSLTEVRFPYSVKNIYYNSFDGCININEVYAPWETPVTCSSNAFSFKLDNTTLFVPDGTEGKYAVATGWEKFVNIKAYDPTGVDGVLLGIPAFGSEMFDISGRRLENVLPGQMYIMNGKKYLK